MSGCFDYLWEKEERFQSRMDVELKKYLSYVWNYSKIIEKEGSMTKKEYDKIILSNLKLFTQEMEEKLLEQKNVEDAKELFKLMQ